MLRALRHITKLWDMEIDMLSKAIAIFVLVVLFFVITRAMAAVKNNKYGCKSNDKASVTPIDRFGARKVYHGDGCPYCGSLRTVEVPNSSLIGSDRNDIKIKFICGRCVGRYERRFMYKHTVYNA